MQIQRGNLIFKVLGIKHLNNIHNYNYYMKKIVFFKSDHKHLRKILKIGHNLFRSIKTLVKKIIQIIMGIFQIEIKQNNWIKFKKNKL